MRDMMKYIVAILFSGLLVSCSGTNSRSVQYFPNMYEPVGYEAYGEYEVFENDTEAELPVDGSIPRGWLPYNYDNTTEGYQLAKTSLKNPNRYSKDNEAAGQQLYTIYCAICHGDEGNGKGYLVQQEKILGVPSYDDQGRAITEGSIYHVMYYGINTMGSYASQTDENERWQIVQYVEKLKSELEGGTTRLDTLDVGDSASMASSENNLIPAVNQREEIENDQSDTSVFTEGVSTDDASSEVEENSNSTDAPVSKKFIEDNKDRDQED